MTKWNLLTGSGESEAYDKPSPKRMVTLQEIASLLHVHPNTVRHWSDEGLLNSYRIGPRGDRRFSWEDIRSFVYDRCKSTTPSKLHNGRVLIVDDDYRIRSLLTAVAKEQGCEVVSVESGERALEELEKRDFDLVFLDLVLAGLSGVDVLSAIEAKNSKALVAVVTGYDDGPIAFDTMSLRPLVLVPKTIDAVDATGIVTLAMSATRYRVIPI